MARPGEFVDPDYDKRLAEFKAKRDEMRREMAAEKKQEPVVNRSQLGNRQTPATANRTQPSNTRRF